MKHRFFISLLASLVMGVEAVAQKVLLPYGQETKEAWDAKYFLAPIGGDEPPADWFEPSFDDSRWNDIKGPVSTAEGGPEFYSTLWGDNYTTYWIRRSFDAEDIQNVRSLLLKVIHDDECEAYLNGNSIYSYSSVHSSLNTIEIPAILVKEKNVLAIRVSDSGGGYAYVDCGLIGNSLVNPNFDSDKGWTGSYDRHSYDGNTEGYKYGMNWECEQSFEKQPAGLYRLSANACGMNYYNDYNTAWANRNNTLNQQLFIENAECPIPSAFSEPSETDIYNDWRWEINGTFVPWHIYCVPAAFKRGMYKTEVWSTFEPTEEDSLLTVGIKCYANNDINRWAAWDNMELTYFNETEVKAMLDSIINVEKDLVKLHLNKDTKDKMNDYIAIAEKSSEYIDKSKSFVDLINWEKEVCSSIKNYERMPVLSATLKDSLANIGDMVSPQTIAEANALTKELDECYESGAYTTDDINKADSYTNKLLERLDYTYLDIAVTVPGSMGDSILAKVENFVDVKSLKISGTLNSDDIATIQSRLTNLRELDMTDVNMTALPNGMFYQREALEIVKLPANLISIGEYAFYQCYGIKNIDFPSTLTTIYNYAFDECDNLQQVILPEGVTSLGYMSFHSCDNNKYVKLPSTLKSISEQCFRYNLNLQQVDFAEGLTHIFGLAFYECYSLRSLHFPNSLYFIGDNAFAYNRSLSEVEFKEGLYQICDNAFYDCDGLTEVTLPSSLVLANESPFDYCDNLRKVTCLSLEPPYMTDQIPYGCSMEGRELYVPALSINTYKQTAGWDKFPTIKPIDYLPENFTVLSNFKLTLPETIPADYKPNVDIIHDQKGSGYWNYGSLTVNGAGTISMSSFQMVWDPNYQYVYNDRNQNYCSLVNNSHLRADKVDILSYPRNDSWNFISFPYNVKMSEIAPIAEGTTNWVVRRYDGEKRAAGETSSTWVRLGSDDILEAGKGYILQSSRYIGNNWQEYSGFKVPAIDDAHKNDIFLADNAVVKLNEYESEFAHNRSWNLIGNPYPCYYDTRFMDFDAPITVWNMNNNTYTAYSPVDDSYVLLPGEAFFVQRPVDSESITFSKEGRQTNRTVRTIEVPAKAKASAIATPRTVVNLTLSDGTSTDRTRLVVNEAATMDYEISRDANKFFSLDPTAPQLYSVNGDIEYAINERPMNDGKFQIKARIAADGIYTIALDNTVEGYNVILEDNTTGKRTVLNKENYVFNVEQGNALFQFTIYLQSIPPTSIDGIENSDNANSEKLYRIDGIKAEGSVRGGLYIQDNKKVILK